jgi:thioredoxin-like negative regulator of GroEL
MNVAADFACGPAVWALFQFRQSPPITQILAPQPGAGLDVSKVASKMDKIDGLKEILAADPRNSFARYGMAMELASRGDTAAALVEFDTLLANDPGYTQGYFMAAQTLVRAGRKPEAIERLKAGINCATRDGNSHAVNEMQTMMDELQRL